MIGRTVSSHPEIDGRIESPGTYRLIERIATTQDLSGKLGMAVRKRALTAMLRVLCLRRAKFVLEKSHPSLWLAEYLSRAISSSLFIGVWREVEPTVASMLRHGGVLSWYRRLPQDQPNRFLGITASNAASFETLTLEEKCAWRWLSHFNELQRLKKALGDRMTVINYDEFVSDPDGHLAQLAEFLEVDNLFQVEEIQESSLDKWKSELSPEQLERIRQVGSLRDTSED